MHRDVSKRVVCCLATSCSRQSVKKLETTGMVKTDSTAAGGGQAAKPVAVGKSSRAPTLRLREGSRVQVEGLKAKGLGDIGSKVGEGREAALATTGNACPKERLASQEPHYWLACGLTDWRLRLCSHDALSAVQFFTFGAKKEPDLFVRFSMGSMIPPCRTKAVAKTKQTCDWGEEVVEVRASSSSGAPTNEGGRDVLIIRCSPGR